jgi:WD40 repeat protein
MSALAQPLLSPAPAVAQTTPQAVSGAAAKPVQQSPENVLSQKVRDGFKEIRASVINAFSSSAFDFKAKCDIMKVSYKHNLLIGACNSNFSICLINIADKSLANPFFTKIDRVTCLRLNEDESEIFLGTEDGKIVKFKFPNMSVDEREEFEIGENDVIFDYVKSGDNEALYACSQDFHAIYRIDLRTKEKETIGRFDEPIYIRVSKNDKHVALVNQTEVLVLSRTHQWSEFLYKIKLHDEEPDYSKLCEIEFSHCGEKLGISYDNYIEIWNLAKHEFEKKYVLNTESDITAFKFSAFDEYLVGVGVDRSINVWDLKQAPGVPTFMNKPLEDHDKKKDPSSTQNYYDLDVDEDRNWIYTHQRSSNYSFRWKGIFLDQAKFPDSGFNKEDQKILIVEKKGHLLVSNTKEKEIVVWEIEGMKKVANIKLLTLPGDFAVDGSQEKVYVGGEGKIYEVAVEGYGVGNVIDCNWAGTISAIKVTNEFIVSGGTSKKIVVQNRSGVLIREVDVHKERITAMNIVANYLITGDASGGILIHYLNPWGLYASLAEHTSAIRTIQLLKNQDTLISVAQDNKCIFWSLYDHTYIKIKRLSDEVDSCYLSNDERSLILSTSKGEVSVYNMPSFDKIISRTYKSAKFQKFTLDKDEKYLLISNSSGVYRTKSLISKENLIIIGPHINIPQVRQFLSNNPDDETDNDKWIISPYMVNSLHYYASENQKLKIKKAMQNGSLFLTSSIGTPLDISLLKKNTEATGGFINQLKLRVKKDRYALETISDCLVALNKGGFKKLEELYNDCLVVTGEKGLPKYCDQGISLPVVKKTLTMKVSPDLFIGTGPAPDEGQRIQFLISTIRMNVQPGSRESIEFLESLLKCSNTEIFKTKFIQTILNDKWNQVKWIMIANALLFITYLLFLSLFVVARESWYLHVCFVASAFLFLYELLQMALDIVEYIKDPWNYLDLARTAVFYVFYYSVFYVDNTVTNPDGSSFTDLSPYTAQLCALTMLSCVRGITLFGLSTSTRYMISLLNEVLIDIIPFAAVVMYSILSFALITLSVEHTDSDWVSELSVAYDTVVVSYFNAIGGFDIGVAGFSKVMIFINSIFNVIIMMNLLISILSSTYERVNEQAQVEDLKQLTDMIIEAESLLFYNKSNKTRSIIQICEEYTPPEVVGAADIKMRFRTMKNVIDAVRLQNDNNHKANVKITADLLKIASDSAARIDASKKEILGELKNAMEDIKKQILSSSQTEAKEKEADKDPFVCLKGHPLIENDDTYGRVCDVCSKEIDGEEALSCPLCDFDMCKECAELYYEHSKVKTGLSCHKTHTLLHFKDLASYLKEEKIEAQLCRQCKKDITGKGFYCVPCMFSVCHKCSEKFRKIDDLKTKPKCDNKHTLKWKHQELIAKKDWLFHARNARKTLRGLGLTRVWSVRLTGALVVCIRKMRLILRKSSQLTRVKRRKMRREAKGRRERKMREKNEAKRMRARRVMRMKIAAITMMMMMMIAMKAMIAMSISRIKLEIDGLGNRRKVRVLRLENGGSWSNCQSN